MMSTILSISCVYLRMRNVCFSLVDVLFNEIQSRTLTFQKILCYLLHCKPFKNDEKSFSFHFKSSFRSQDIEVFLMTFCACKKNGLIRKIRLISTFMTSQPSYQSIAIDILPIVSRSKSNQ